VFALSSDEEGLGMVMLESMACGIPVVSTACGGPDSIVRDGVDGFLVPPNDPASFADRLARLVTDEALNRRMGASARSTVLARFDSRRAGEALLDIYDELLGIAPAARAVAW
jgi:glycosyltransferase involved in cell wall biosynthesis